ncbi:HutD family protein [Specibacter cremeus]|uniref:HutD/Ves family protein n=1 Tax=Specibacter cremeus TaxID=1629051 RepID=UPI000F7B5D15|nr:HutD family protein [Specibacter cremeus]
MRIIRYAALEPGRWANGGGVTRQVAAGLVGPPDGHPWDWRISIAEVAAAGPFSPLPGIDRILTIIDGDLIALTVDGAEHALEKYRPFRFPGDAATSATLPTGSLVDLNLMTRRGVCKGFAVVLELSKQRPHPVFAGQHAVLLQGSATVTAPSTAGTGDDGTAPGADGADTVDRFNLGRFDTVVGADAPPEITGRGFLAVLTVDPA